MTVNVGDTGRSPGLAGSRRGDEWRALYEGVPPIVSPEAEGRLVVISGTGRRWSLGLSLPQPMSPPAGRNLAARDCPC
jgi:hypothetical protein